MTEWVTFIYISRKTKVAAITNHVWPSQWMRECGRVNRQLEIGVQRESEILSCKQIEKAWMTDALSMTTENTRAQNMTINCTRLHSPKLITVLLHVSSLLFFWFGRCQLVKLVKENAPRYRYKANTKACADLPLSTRSLSEWLLFYHQWGVQRIPHTRQGFVLTASTEKM